MFRKSAPVSPIPAQDRRHALRCIPLRNPEANESVNNAGILLTYQVTIKPWFQRIFRHLANRDSTIITRKLQLDTLGSSVWKMIDGKSSVLEIAEAFQEIHQLTNREAEIAVTGFMRELGKRGLIALREGEKEP